MTHTTLARLESRLFRIGVERFGLDIDHTWILEVPGRRTGVPRFAPVKLLEVETEHYLVALHHDSDWPRNLREAAGSARLRHRRRIIAVRALELPPQERTRILRHYLDMATRGQTLDILGAGRRDPEESHLRRIAADHPVFRLTLADETLRRAGPEGLTVTGLGDRGHRGDRPGPSRPPAHRKKLLVRADGAGSSRGLLDWLTGQDAKRGRSVDYSVGFAVTDQVRTAVSQVPAKAWTTAIPARARRSSASRLETTERSVTALLRRGATHGEGW